MYTHIRDYAIIGNLRSCALVSKNGSIDWMPAPFIDSPSVFSGILDEQNGGSWQIHPETKYISKQHYISETNILCTTFETSKGDILEIIDYIPIETKDNLSLEIHSAQFQICRKVTCKKGNIPIQFIFSPRFNYGRDQMKLSVNEDGASIYSKSESGLLYTDMPVQISWDNTTGGANFLLNEQETRTFVFFYNFDKHDIAVESNLLEKRLRDTTSFWLDWVRKPDPVTYPQDGPYRDGVVRSSLLLKILFFDPVGSIAAAPTTSLPEEIGGVRNWDYRYMWVRDASFTVQALLRLGYENEALKFLRSLVSWCSKLPHGNMEHLQVMYGLRGESDLIEEILSNLEGYENSKPVRIGNNAFRQKQWDIYGSILDAAWSLHVLKGGTITKETWPLLRSLAQYTKKIWREPDEGLWEVRAGKRQFTYSKVMCWVALDRAVKIAHAYNYEGEIHEWEQEKEMIRNEVMERGFSKKKKSFVQSFDSHDLDASALLFPALGFISGEDPKMTGTIDAIRDELEVREGFLLRYDSEDGLPGKEGVFLPASFWLVDALVLSNQKKTATALFEKIIAKANHVGLFSEEMNPQTGAFLGNFPQAYTHIGLINSAFRLL